MYGKVPVVLPDFPVRDFSSFFIPIQSRIVVDPLIPEAVSQMWSGG